MGGEGAEVVHIPLGAVRIRVLVVVDTGLPDDHGVGRTATAGRLHVGSIVRTAVQGGTIVAALVDGHTAPRGDVKKTSPVSQTHSSGQ